MRMLTHGEEASQGWSFRSRDCRADIRGAEMISNSEATESNRTLWNEWAAIHAESKWYNVDAVRAGAEKLRPYEIDEVGDVAGRTMLHLQCQIGTDSIGWARRGAKVTGVDFSPVAVEFASELASEVGVDAEFVCSDVMKLTENLNDVWDIVYTSRGVIGWLPDLNVWARTISHFLKPGGFLYVTDIHPVANSVDDTSSEFQLGRAYWPRATAIHHDVNGSYVDQSAKVQTADKYVWQHSTGELITAVAQADLHVEFFHEFPWLDRPWPSLTKKSEREFWLPEQIELPMFFSLRARKL
jgi:SAM-dependent methyltransferase